MPAIEQINEIAWALSLASAREKYQIAGEFAWAYPSNDKFWEVRARARSMFSGGHAINDAEVLAAISNTDVVCGLSNPRAVPEFEENFVHWIQQATHYKLHNLDLFKYRGFSAGTLESFINHYMMNRNKRFRVFRGDFWRHMDTWAKLNLSWAYIEDGPLDVNDICVVSHPFALTGKKHAQFEQLLDECDRLGIECLVDLIYIFNSDHIVDIDLSRDCIKQVVLSLTKTFPIQSAKVGIRMLKLAPNDPMQSTNEENVCNRLSAALGTALINIFSPDYLLTKYKDKQEYLCNKLGLEKSPVVHFGLGDDYTKYGREKALNWLSPFNEQQNRYNLGMLFENEKLLRDLGLW